MSKTLKQSQDNIAVYYAINDNPLYLYFTRRSIESLKKFNPEIPVYLYFYGDYSNINFILFENMKVNVIKKDGLDKKYTTSLKWLCLEDLKELKEERLLFADADTLFFDDLNKLLNKCQDGDFYARKEVGTEEDNKITTIGNSHFLNNFSYKAFNILAKAFKFKPVPVFNTGLMLFNHNIFKKIPDYLDFYKQLHDNFLNKKLPYPSMTDHLIDEVLSSIILAKMEADCRVLDPDISPWFVDFKEGTVSGKGIVMHLWSGYYYEYLKTYEPEELENFK